MLLAVGCWLLASVFDFNVGCCFGSRGFQSIQLVQLSSAQLNSLLSLGFFGFAEFDAVSDLLLLPFQPCLELGLDVYGFGGQRLLVSKKLVMLL